MQAMLHAILDDASRLIPHAQFYASQGLDACLDCLRQSIAARGAGPRPAGVDRTGSADPL